MSQTLYNSLAISDSETLRIKKNLESIQSDVSDMSEDLEDVISPLADPYGNDLQRRILCFRRSRK